MIRLLAPIFAMLFAAQALAQSNCGLRDVTIAMLKAKYGEVPLFEAVTIVPGQPPMEVMVFANARTGTWTFASSPDPAMLCPFLAGKGFKMPTVKPTGRAL